MKYVKGKLSCQNIVNVKREIFARVKSFAKKSEIISKLID